ncbi:baculoviral IAP repeat-containing protein 7-B-like isoform X2 [Mya arenaria]|uniref:baculoviral IAP repeat-containing protein 7-B-like isoform X2 n=1 Tax=Mya arenaria TaxID=6604 RepID=UPI0022E32647|nr:baculoviral IAP repeat-containing protein 7-B-like isoform X2 [Mya arenaria]
MNFANMEMLTCCHQTGVCRIRVVNQDLNSLQFKRNRLWTVSSFPCVPTVICIKLTANGLFYSGNNVEVECYECGVRHSCWRIYNLLYQIISRLHIIHQLQCSTDAWGDHLRNTIDLSRFTHDLVRSFPESDNRENSTGRKREAVARLRAENEKLRRSMTCIICKERETVVLFRPCSHLVTCENCAATFANCPVCRRKIEGSIRVRRA